MTCRLEAAPARILRRIAAGVLLAIVGVQPLRAQDIETPASHVILMDFDTETVLFARNADEPMPPSSMSKLMTVYMVFEKLAAGQLKLEDKLPVSERAWRTQGSKMFVPLGGQVSVGDLLRGVIVQSGNDACVVLAEGIGGTEERFAEMMTQRARELGLKASVFKNASGWPHPEHVMTAHELALLSKLTIKNFPQFYPIYAELDFTFGVDEKSGRPIKQGNRNPLLYKTLGADGLKTGHTEAAGYGLTASAKRGDRRLILVVNGLKSMKQRAEESERLLEIGFREFDTYKLLAGGATLDEADVWLGTAARVPLVLENDVTLGMLKRHRPGVKVAVVYDGPIAAPIKKGAPLARLVISLPDREPIERPLVAGADVERLGLFGRIGAAVSYLALGSGRK